MVRWPLRIQGIWARSSTPARRTRRPCATCGRRAMGVTPSAWTWSRTKRSGWALTLRLELDADALLARPVGEEGERRELLVEGEARLVEAFVGGRSRAGRHLAPRRPRPGVEQRHLRDELLAAHPESVEGAEAHEVLRDLAAHPVSYTHLTLPTKRIV